MSATNDYHAVYKRSKPKHLYLELDEKEGLPQHSFAGSHLVKDFSANGTYASTFFKTLDDQQFKEPSDMTPDSHYEINQTTLVQNISVLDDNSLTNQALASPLKRKVSFRNGH